MALEDFWVKSRLTSFAFTLVYDWRAAHVVRIVDVREVINLWTQSENCPGGDYQVELLLCSPRLIHCFNFTAKPGDQEVKINLKIKVDFTEAPSQVKRHQPFRLELSVTDTESITPVDDLNDLVVLVSQLGGNWSQRYLAVSRGCGKYELELKLPQAGRFSILLNLKSQGLGMTDLPGLSLDMSE